MFLARISHATQQSMSDRLKALRATNVLQIAGVGDEAAWGSMTAAGMTICMLSARKGKSGSLLLMIGGLPDDADTLTRVKTLAVKILSKT